MSVVSYERQSQLLDPIQAADTSIAILGCGTVGSWAATCLIKAGFTNLFLADMDAVEGLNLPSQAFGINDIGTNKAIALRDHLNLLADTSSIIVQDWELDGTEQYASGVILSAVDNMELRGEIFRNAAKGKHDSLFIDFRMGGNLLKVWAFDPSDERRCTQYEQSLHSTASAAELPCGGRTFAPVGPLAGAIAVQLVTKWLRNNDNPPFHIQMDFDRFQSYAIGLPNNEDNNE